MTLEKFQQTMTFTHRLPIAWGDMDAFNHVNNVQYFRYFESARIQWFGTLNWLEIMQETGVGPILKSTACNYKIPLTFPDHIHVGMTFTPQGEDRFTINYSVYSEKLQRVSSEGSAVIVCFDFKNQIKATLPENVRQAIAP